MRRRVIELGSQSSAPAAVKGADEMLISIGRDGFTDTMYITVWVGSFDFQLRSAQRPADYAQAVELARNYLRESEFTGRVRWQRGSEGPVTDEP